MFEDRRDAAEADEDGGRGGDEKFFSAAKSLSTGTTRKVAMVSQHTGQGLYEQVVNETLWKIIKRTTRRNV
jgi:hypothetical protein